MPKTPKPQLRIALVALVSAILLLAAFRFQTIGEHSHAVVKFSASVSRLANLPPVILWAWERPEKLDYFDPQKVGVAFLAKTIYLRANEVVARPRLQPLTVPDGAAVIAVARIESARVQATRVDSQQSESPPTLSQEQMKAAAAEIAELGSLPNVVMVQVDFDATTSERSFYRGLLHELRGKLPPSTLLSITALASWCKGDNWLENLPIDEAVPMLFRMGVERRQFLSQLVAGERFSAGPCQTSAGISTDEPIAQLPQVPRVYVFNPKSWTPEAINQTMETYER
jgi:hypothetical protein